MFICYPDTASEFMQVLIPCGMQATNDAMAQHALPEHFMADFHCDEQTVEDILETPH